MVKVNHFSIIAYRSTFGWDNLIQLDSCHCLPCCLFASTEAKVQNFVQQPYRNWTKFNDKVKAHSVCSVHNESVLAMKSFEEVHSGMQPSIDMSLSMHQQRLLVPISTD